MEEYVLINGLHSYKDLHLYLRKKTIQQPEIKENKISIPGSDITLNLMKAISGRTNYGLRKIKLEFQMVDITNTFSDNYSRIADLFHGEECKLIFSSDLEFYYLGTGKVSKGEKEGRVGEITLEVSAEPYKYDIRATDESIEWDSFNFETGIWQELSEIPINTEGVTITVLAGKRPASPLLWVENSTTVVFKGVEYSLEPGWNKVTGIYFLLGENQLTFYGEGMVTVQYRGGGL